MTTEAVIVSTARTGVGKAYRGALNNTEGPTLAGHVISEAVKRAGIAPGEVEDVVMGCAMQQGTMVMNVARKGAIRAGLPVTIAGTTIDRQCASGLQAIAVAARSVMHDGIEIAIGGGIEFDQPGPERAHEPLPCRRRRVDGDEGRKCTCRCWTPPKSSPHVTRSAATGRTNTRSNASAASAPRCRVAASTTRSCHSRQKWRWSTRIPRRSPTSR